MYVAPLIPSRRPFEVSPSPPILVIVNSMLILYLIPLDLSVRGPDREELREEKREFGLEAV